VNAAGATSAGGAFISDPRTRTWAEPGGAVAGIRRAALVEKETAAADALGEARADGFEIGDALVDGAGPTAREFRPMGAHGRAVGGEFGELLGDFVERQSDVPGEDDEGDAEQDFKGGSGGGPRGERSDLMRRRSSEKGRAEAATALRATLRRSGAGRTDR
jgi:hypothetical protein